MKWNFVFPKTESGSPSAVINVEETSDNFDPKEFNLSNSSLEIIVTADPVSISMSQFVSPIPILTTQQELEMADSRKIGGLFIVSLLKFVSLWVGLLASSTTLSL